MAIARVYIDNIINDIDSIMSLDLNSYHHIIRVCRHKVGDNIILFDGSDLDQQFLVEIINSDKKNFQVKILEKQITKTKSPVQINLFPALAKGNTFDFLLQKSVELGVSEITPVITRYTQSLFSIKDKKKLESKLYHWQKVIIGACEQCGLNIIPKLNEPKDFKNCVKNCVKNINNEELFLVATGPLEISRLKDNLEIDKGDIKILNGSGLLDLNKNKNKNKTNLFIGPEGGFSFEEMIFSYTNKACFICLGGRILRMETAPIVLISILQAVFGDF